MSTNSEMSARWSAVMQANYGLPQISLVRGAGVEVWDAQGNRYLDFLGGIATNILGHAHPEVVAAIHKQSQTLSHVSNLYSHPSGVLLAEKLQSFVGDQSARVFFCNSGAEANESAIKLSRLTGRKRIISTLGSFHGRTMGALSITGQESKRLAFKPLLGKIQYVPFDDLAAAKRAISKKISMFIVEPIQGENGVVVPKPGYLQGLRELTTKHGVLLAIDAVQTGMGRTGTWFGYENEKITPDVITLAKGLGGGLPLGAMIAIGDAASYFKPGSHGSTFGGNPISCASALAAISVLERDGLLKQCLDFEALLKREIGQINSVLEVRGAGLLLGIVLKENKAKDFAVKLQAAGVLVNAATESVIRIAPPLIVSQAQVSEFVQIFRKVATENGY